MSEMIVLRILGGVYAAAFSFAFVSAARRLRLFDLIPSIAWAVFMLFPFVFQLPYFDESRIGIQGFGVFLLGFTLLGADCCPVPRRASVDDAIDSRDGRVLLSVAYGLIALSLVLQIVHIYLMPAVPLFLKWGLTNHATMSPEELSNAREAASKTLNVSPVFIYGVQLTLLFLGPIVLAILYRARRYWIALAYLGVLLFYSRVTTAKGPFYEVCLLSAFIPWSAFSDGSKRRVMRWGISGMLVFSIVLAILLSTSRFGLFRYRVPEVKHFDESVVSLLSDTQKKIFTIPDASRRVSDLEPEYRTSNGVVRELNFWVYRMILVPSEVSHWWYVYFPEIAGGHIGLSDLSPKFRANPLFQHPANRVGLYAFKARHPSHYGETNRSYASADADAYARFGAIGIVVLAIVVFIIRATVQYYRRPGFWGDYITTCFVITFGLTLPQGSIFATLIAQGSGFFFGLVMLIAFYSASRKASHGSP